MIENIDPPGNSALGRLACESRSGGGCVRSHPEEPGLPSGGSGKALKGFEEGSIQISS